VSAPGEGVIPLATTTPTPPRRRRSPARLLALAAASVAAVLLVGILTRDGQSTTTRPAAGTAPAGTVPTGRVGSAPAAPAELGLQLQSLLGQHMVLAADMMRGRLRDDPDLAQAANGALGKNTAAMGAIVGTAFGEQARRQFTPQWSGHVAALFNYARGLAEKDEAVRARARAATSAFERDISGFFSAASQGRLPRAGAEAAVAMHIDHLLRQADAYAAGDWARSDRYYREGYSHAVGLGRTLAATLLPPAVARTLQEPTWRLRSELGRLLGEHVVLVVAATRAGVTDSPHFTAAAGSVDGNTRDLAGAVDVLFGPAAARRFQGLWADHVDLLVAYSAAVAKGDDARRAEVGRSLGGFERGLSAFLAAATGNKVTAAALARALRSHDAMLQRQIDAFVGKKYVDAHDIAYSTYQEMYGLAGQLSGAFGGTVAARLPRGAADTGRGGMAGAVGGR
jgi:hypothetical protein